MNDPGMTLSQFQQYLGNAVRMAREVQNVWIQAELSDLRVVGGHCYMELIEKDDRGTTRAKIRAMIWAGTLGAVRRKFTAATGREIASGMKVLVRGSATHHNLYGLSVTISDIDPNYTLGDMERIRREILDRLTREGVLNANRVLPFPVAPQRIAVISAAGAAGYGDFINQLDTNPDGFVIYPVLFQAVMQGERTAPSVMAALDKIEMTIDQWDAVVIVRGGGATTDLNGFDNYDLAHRVATFPLPVVVGIGHERDRTVLDEIACVRCKTPTAVAAWIIDSLRAAYTGAAEAVRRIAKYGADALRGEHMRLANLIQMVPATAQSQLARRKMRLASLAQGLPVRLQGSMNTQRLMLDRTAMRLTTAAGKIQQRESLRLERMEAVMRVLDPVNTLRRGYSITRAEGRAVTEPAKLPPGTIIETTLAGGKITSVTASPAAEALT